MERRNILRLQVNRALIISFRLFIFSKFIPAKCSIVISFEMLRIYSNSIFIVLNRPIKNPFLSEGESSIMKEISFIRFNRDSFCKTFDSLIKISFSIQTDSFIVIGVSIIWIDLDCFRIVFNCIVKVTDLIISKPSIKQSFEVSRQYF